MNKILHRKKCYTGFRSEDLETGKCRIIATYFTFRGNMLQDATFKSTEVIMCSNADKAVIEKDLTMQIINTKKRLVKSVMHMGGTEANAYAIARQKMQKVL